MTFQLFPTISFIAIFFNFLAWYVHGQPLFSWWHLAWILPGEQLLEHMASDLQMRVFKKYGIK